mgnify:CR=1 FL=1
MGQIRNIEEDLLYRDISKLPKVNWENLSSNEKIRINNFLKSQNGLEKTIGPSSMKYISGYDYNGIVFYRD